MKQIPKLTDTTGSTAGADATGMPAGAGATGMPAVADAAGLPLVADATLRRLEPGVWSGGSPLRVFRLTERGDRILAELLDSGRWSPDGEAERSLSERLVDAGAAHPVPLRGHGRDHDAPDPAEVTVVIPVRDDPRGLAALLDDLCGAGAVELGGVIVVDDGSRQPELIEAILAEHVPAALGVATRGAATRGASLPGVELIVHDTARGPGAARNTGLGAVRTPLVAFIDADVRPGQTWLEPLLAHLVDPRVVAVAPRVLTEEGGGRLARHDAQHGPLDMGPHPARVVPRSRVPYVPSATLVARTDALGGIGGFDEALRFGEDVDLVWRMTGAGGTVRYEPSVAVAHRARPDLGSWLRQRVDYGSSAAALDDRHRGSVAPVYASPWSASAWGAAALGQPVLGAVLAAGSAAALARKLSHLRTRTAMGLALQGHLGAGRQMARALIRPWWPFTLTAAVLSRRARRIGIVAVATHLLTTPGNAVDRSLSLLGDMAYSVGVLKGAVTQRNPGALLPGSAEPTRVGRPAVSNRHLMRCLQRPLSR